MEDLSQNIMSFETEYLSNRDIVNFENFKEKTGYDVQLGHRKDINLFKTMTQLFPFRDRDDFYDEMKADFSIIVNPGMPAAFGSTCICGKLDVKNFNYIFKNQFPQRVYRVGSSCIKHFKTQKCCSQCNNPVSRGFICSNCRWLHLQNKQLVQQKQQILALPSTAHIEIFDEFTQHLQVFKDALLNDIAQMDGQIQNALNKKDQIMTVGKFKGKTIDQIYQQRDSHYKWVYNWLKTIDFGSQQLVDLYNYFRAKENLDPIDPNVVILYEHPVTHCLL